MRIRFTAHKVEGEAGFAAATRAIEASVEAHNGGSTVQLELDGIHQIEWPEGHPLQSLKSFGFSLIKIEGRRMTAAIEEAGKTTRLEATLDLIDRRRFVRVSGYRTNLEPDET